jgi:putative membrane protein
VSLLFSWLILSVAFLATAWLLPGMKVNGLGGAAAAAAVFGILNWLLGKALFIAFGIVTLGIGFVLFFVTAWVVNVVLLKITNKLTDAIELETTGTAMAAALLISLISGFLKLVF